MDKVRISEIAQELGLAPKEVLAHANEINIKAKAANSGVSVEEAEMLMDYILTGKKPPHLQSKSSPKTQDTQPKEQEQTQNDKSKKEQKSVKKIEEKEQKELKPPKIKEEDKKEEKTQQQTKDPQPLKEEAKKDIEEKIQQKEQEPKKEEKEKPRSPTRASNSLMGRRGIVVIRKKRDKDKEKQKKEEEQKSIQPAPEISMPEAVPGVKKKKKVKKTPATSKKEEAQKLDIFGGDISSIDVISEENMVYLKDLTADDEEKQKEETPKKKVDTAKVRTGRSASFIQQTGISRKSKKKKKQKQKQKQDESVKSVEIPEDIRVYEFAEKINKPISEIIRVLFDLGVMVTKNDFLDKDAIEILADEFDIEVKTVNPLDEFDIEKIYEQMNKDLKEEDLEPRPPVITIMGHVDHGKTSLLDKIRSTQVAAREHGGITQHIGAYMVEKNGQHITFIDTPGHAAFTSMRARGAKVTDIAIIVVAADDGVKPQTKEAIEHARAADVPFIVAINKIDKPSANPDMVKAGLAELGVVPVDWGGDVEFVHVSAHTGEGIDDLLENILLQAEILDLKANKKAKPKAVVIESSLEKGRGPVGTVIMQNGTLRVGDIVLCGTAHGRVRAIIDENKKSLKELYPGQPGVVVGLNEVPPAGEILIGMNSEKEAKELANKKAEYLRQKELSKSTKVISIDELGMKIAEGQIKSLPVILKADVAGTLEALKASLEKLRTDEVKVNIISSGVGGISESDLALAEASENCVIFGFNVRPTGSIKEKAKKMGVRISTYNVIYDLIDDVKSLLSGMMSPIQREEQLGQAEVKEVFNVPKLGQVAGCIVTDGAIHRGAQVRVIRDGVVIFEGEISSLKRFKDDVKEVPKGYECGIGIVGYKDIKPGDFLESFKIVEDKATIEVSDG